jgi:hypothetical protein
MSPRSHGEHGEEIKPRDFPEPLIGNFFATTIGFINHKLKLELQTIAQAF